MKQRECIEYLKRNQPMPPDDEWDEECEKLDEVLEFITNSPVLEALPLLLNVFGEGSGFGVYQLVEFAIRKYRAKDVIPQLMQTLTSPSKSIVYWNAQIAASFPDVRLIEPLSVLVRSEDEDIQAASITAIGQIKSPKVLAVLESLNSSDLNEDMRELISDGLENQK